MRRNQSEIEFKVGVFVASGVLLIMAMVMMVGGFDSWFTKQYKYHSYFDDIGGLITGSKVTINGLRVGAVQAVAYAPEKNLLRVDLVVSSEFKDLIRTDASAEIATQGILGDKFIAINGGSAAAGPLAVNSEIKTTSGKGLTQFLSKSDELVGNLNSITRTLDRVLKNFDGNRRAETLFEGLAVTSKNLAILSEKVNREVDHLQIREISTNLKQILAKINDGTGTIGALINDPDLYYDLRALLGGVNRNRIMRNLVRQTVQDAHANEKAPTAPAAEASPKKP